MPPTSSLFVRLISHQPAVLFSQNKPTTSNQPAVLFSQNKSTPAISHQPNEQAAGIEGSSPLAVHIQSDEEHNHMTREGAGDEKNERVTFCG
jgi:hypothetical protein